MNSYTLRNDLQQCTLAAVYDSVIKISKVKNHCIRLTMWPPRELPSGSAEYGNITVSFNARAS